MPRRRFSLFDLFLFVAFCALVLAFVMPLFRGRAGRRNVVQDLAISADGSTVAALFANGKVRVWRAADQSLVAAFDSGASVFRSQLAISSDGRLAAVFTGFAPRRKRAGEIEIWDTGNARRIATVPSLWNASLAFSSNDALLAVGNQDSSVDLYRCAQDGPPLLVRKLNVGDEAITQTGDCPPIAFSGDGKTLAAQSSAAVWFWNVETGELGKRLAIDHGLFAPRMAFSGDGRYVAFNGYDSQSAEDEYKLDVWDVATSKKIPTLPQSEETEDAFGGTYSLAFLPDARTLVAADQILHLRAWNLQTREVQIVANDAQATPTMLAAPRRGNRFAAANFERITLWDATTFEPREVLWTPPARSQPIPVVLGAAALLLIWTFRSAKQLRRRCASCGRTFYLANRKESQTECAFCRVQAMPAGERKQEQSKERREWRKLWRTLGLALLLGMLFFLIQNAAPLWAVGAVLLAIPAAILVMAGALIGFTVLKHRWRRRRLLREANFVQLAEQSAGSLGETLHSGLMLVWSEPGTTLGREFESQLADVADRVRSLTGQSPALQPWFRCFVFSNRLHFAKCLEGADSTPINLSEANSLYLPSPWRTAIVDESQLCEPGEQPLEVVRGLIASRFVDALAVSQRRPWLFLGLSSAIANVPRPDKLARLNRHMLSALAAKRTLDAQNFFAKSPWIRFFNAYSENEQSLFAKSAAEGDQYWSFMEFLCGAGSTPERRLAFQQFLADSRRQKRQDEALVASFGCSPEKLLDDWRRWVEQFGVGRHVPPPAEYAEVLASGPVATIENEQAPLIERLRAIRRLGREGFIVGVDALIGVLRRGPEDLTDDAVWALEAISAQPLGADVAAWEAWRANLPAEIGDSQSQIR